MSTKQIMFMGLLLAAGTLISMTFGGAWFTSYDLDVVNSFNVFKQVTILGTWSVTIPNISFFLTGAKALIMMDFAFFTGPLQIVQWFFFFIFGLGVIWGIYVIIISIVQGILRR
jgi:hypothetical protein